MEAEFFNADAQTDRQTDRHDESNSQFSQFSKRDEIHFPVIEFLKIYNNECLIFAHNSLNFFLRFMQTCLLRLTALKNYPLQSMGSCLPFHTPLHLLPVMIPTGNCVLYYRGQWPSLGEW